MKKWYEMFMSFAKNKLYVVLLALTATGSYGFMITHHTIGMDDTPSAYYFEEGLAAIVGRWVLYLMNKVVSVAEFAPFLTDLAGVLILMVAVTVWCVLFYSVLKDRVPLYGYLFFACVFISCPLISEVYVYYLHNGIAIGYLCCGISLLLFLDGLAAKRQGWISLAISALFLCVALGCYESFMMVWLMGVCMILALKRMCMEKGNVPAVIGIAGAVALVAMVLRSMIIAGVTAVFGLEGLKAEAIQRSVTELTGWIFEPDAFANFAMGIKRAYVMYVAYAAVYYPIKIFMWATVVILIAGIVLSIRKKDAWIGLLIVAGYIAAFSLIFIEGKETYYRSAQFLPIVCGLGALFAVWGVSGNVETKTTWKVRLTSGSRMLVGFLLGVIIWNQCTDMNKWFYMDWQKYESAKETVHSIAYELERSFDISKPVVFTGIYEIPDTIVDDAYVDFGSLDYFKLIRRTVWLDEHLLEKFYRDEGILMAQQPQLSVIEWGRTAFGTDQELINFFRMHGHELKGIEDADEFESVMTEAAEYSLGLPRFPRAGSIVDMGEYIIVHF